MTCADAVREVFEEHPASLSTSEVIARIYRRHPDRPWKKSTIRAHLTGLSINNPTSRFYPSQKKQAFLFWERGGRYRLWRPQTEGPPPAPEPPESAPAVEVGNGSGTSPESSPETEEAPLSTALSLERDLEETLVRNLSQIEPGLRLYSAVDRYGRQFDTGVVGVIDLLAVDENGDYVVIELKAGRAEEKALAQVLKYMGWVKHELAGGHQVRGIIVANDVADALKYAVQAAPQVKLARYEVHFSFGPVS